MLTADDTSLPLTTRVFDTLLYLVEHAGEIVTKDELLHAVWPDRVVEENNLTQSISALRRAFDDQDGSGKRLILTVPGRGYRFTAEVVDGATEQAGAGAVRAPSRASATERPEVTTRGMDPSSADSLVASALEQAQMGTGHAGAPPPRRPGPWPSAWVPIVAAAFVCVIAAGLYQASGHRVGQPAEPGDIVVAPFSNLTAGAEFDAVLSKALEIDLGQSPDISLMPLAQVRETLRQMARSPDERLSADLALEVCRRNQGRAVVSGTVSTLGSSFLVTLEVDECSTGRKVTQQKKEASGKEALVPALDELVTRARRELGESRASIERFGVPLVQATTASFAALQTYSEAVALSTHGRRPESIPLYQRAIALDPNFAAAYADLAGVYYSLNQDAADVAAISKAYELRDSVTEREKFFIVASYHRSVTRDLDEQVRNLQVWSQTYPRDPSPLINLCNILNFLGRYSLAVEAGKKELLLKPNGETAYVVLSRALRRAGKLEEARTIDEEALAKGLAGDAIHGDLLQLAVARDDRAGVEREIAWAEKNPSELMFQLRGELAFKDGRVRQGQALFERLVALARQHGLQDYTAAARARMLVDLGLVPQARAELARIPESSSPGDYLFTMAEIGDTSVAETILRRDLFEGPTDTVLNAVLAPEVRAALALRGGNPGAAVASLHGVAPYDLRNFDVPFLRGNAYLAAANGERAAAEFQKILDHPGVDPVSPLLILSRLGVARALGLQGKNADARAAYRAFLSAWQEADTDLPLLRAAREESDRVGHS